MLEIDARRYLLARRADVDAFSVLTPGLEVIVVDAAVLYLVVQYLGICDEVVQPYALGTAKKKKEQK